MDADTKVGHVSNAFQICEPGCKLADSGRWDLTAVKTVNSSKRNAQERGERLVNILPKEDTAEGLSNAEDKQMIYSLLQEKHEAFALDETTEQGRTDQD